MSRGAGRGMGRNIANCADVPNMRDCPEWSQERRLQLLLQNGSFEGKTMGLQLVNPRGHAIAVGRSVASCLGQRGYAS
jgi:hypothetical protein